MKRFTLVLFILLAGCAAQPQVTLQAPADGSNLSIGRYQLVSERPPASGGPGQVFVIDTATGQVWTERDPDFRLPKLPTTRP